MTFREIAARLRGAVDRPSAPVVAELRRESNLAVTQAVKLYCEKAHSDTPHFNASFFAGLQPGADGQCPERDLHAIWHDHIMPDLKQRDSNLPDNPAVRDGWEEYSGGAFVMEPVTSAPSFGAIPNRRGSRRPIYHQEDWPTRARNYVAYIETLGDLANEPQIATAQRPLTFEEVVKAAQEWAEADQQMPAGNDKQPEPQIRCALAKHLDQIWRGMVNAESLSHRGRPDIVIRNATGQHVFVAECLVWRGPQYLRSKIKQGQDYITPSNERLAIVAFLRRGKPAPARRRIQEVLSSLPDGATRPPLAGADRDCFECAVTHPGDGERKLRLVVLLLQLGCSEGRRKAKGRERSSK